jgi:hypothetical protein
VLPDGKRVLWLLSLQVSKLTASRGGGPMSDARDEEQRSRPNDTLGLDIKTTRLAAGRRSFLATLGVGFFGATAIAVGQTSPAFARDFPKGSSDSDTTKNRDLKAVDSDSRNSKAVDSDQSRLRDAKRSSDKD